MKHRENAWSIEFFLIAHKKQYCDFFQSDAFSFPYFLRKGVLYKSEDA